MLIRILAAVAGLITCLQLAGQSGSPGTFNLNESILESLVSQDAGDDEFENILAELENLRKNPVDLNTCSRQDLEKIPFLSDFQINSFLNYRIEKGKLLSIYELQVIHGFSDDVVRMMIPYVAVYDESDARTLNLKGIRNARHEAYLRFQRLIEKSKGYTTYDPVADDMRYPGSPWLINARYGFASGNQIKAGITLEKDPGEELFRGTNSGFDYNSAFIMLNNTGAIKSAIVGDYRLAFGQGLTLWSGTSPGKSSMPVSVVKRQDAIKAYTSNDENNFFRGAAASAAFGRFVFTAFFSSKKRDANITDTLSAGHICFSSFQQSGYHRTSSEITDEKSVRETLTGANLIYRNNFMKLGTTIAGYKFDKFLEEGDDLREIDDFAGNRLINGGLDYSLVLKNVQLFGETSLGNGHMATLNGILINTGKYATVTMIYRYFDPGYFSLHSSAFSEGGDDCNEEGLYAGIVLHPVADLKIAAYADFYRFPWLKHEQSKPASGNDFLIQADYSPGKTVEMYLRLKYEADPGDVIADSSVIPDIVDMEKSGIRYHIRYKISDAISMQNRFEMVQSEGSKGFLLYHDATYRLNKIPLELDFRLAWFDTDDFDSRIYAYEQDITAGYSFSPLYDSGLRGYIMATCRITPHVGFSIRYSSTRFFEKNTIGSGYDSIEGHSRNDIKIRLTMEF